MQIKRIHYLLHYFMYIELIRTIKSTSDDKQTIFQSKWESEVSVPNCLWRVGSHFQIKN